MNKISAVNLSLAIIIVALGAANSSKIGDVLFPVAYAQSKQPELFSEAFERHTQQNTNAGIKFFWSCISETHSMNLNFVLYSDTSSGVLYLFNVDKKNPDKKVIYEFSKWSFLSQGKRSGVIFMNVNSASDSYFSINRTGRQENGLPSFVGTAKLPDRDLGVVSCFMKEA